MAGDIREIDMTKVTNLNGKKIRLVGDDGKGYWIEKEDFASVVGELNYSPIFCQPNIPTELTVSEIKEQLAQYIATTILTRENLEKRTIIIFLPGFAKLWVYWDSPNTIVTKSSDMTIQMYNTRNISGGYSCLLLLANGVNGKWGTFSSGTIK